MAADYDETEIRRYLLGELDEEPSAALERDYFAREDLFDRVWAAENDIVDEYLSGRLSAHQRDRFERHYLASPGHRDRVAAARALRSLAAASAAAKPAGQWWWPTIGRASESGRPPGRRPLQRRCWCSPPVVCGSFVLRRARSRR
jgi:anti-sigma factor RsiW